MKLKVTLDEVDMLMNYYVNQASELKNTGDNGSCMNRIKMRLGYWSKIKKELEMEG